MAKFYVYFILSLLIPFLILSEETKEKSETCEGKEEKDVSKTKEKTKEPDPKPTKSEPAKKNYTFLYADLFLNQTKLDFNATNTTEISEYFDLSINPKIAKYVEESGMVPYPHERFIGKQQGNFLHFMHLAYEKGLPVYFGLDQILYPYIEITTKLASDIMAKGLYSAFHQFLKNIVDYGTTQNYEQGIVLYFSIALKFLDNETKVIHDDVCTKLIENILNLPKDEKNTIYNFTLLGHIRSIEKLNFVQIYPLLNKNKKLKKISHCLRFLQNFEFNIENELYTIYKIGNLIQKSGQEKLYKELKSFMYYIFNEEENVMNPLDIFLYISKNYKNKTSKEEISNLYKDIKKGIEKKFSLDIFSNITFINKEEEEEYYKQRNNNTSLFSYSFSVSDFVSYRLLNVRRLRFYPTFFEFIDITHHGKLMRELIFQRYHATNTTPFKLYKFRDGIDVEEEFNSTKELIKQSMKKEKEKWESTYENSFNYLLNIAGHLDKKVKKDNYHLSKTFGTLLGSYVHFQKDILLFEQQTNFNISTNGSIPDLYFDNRTLFYQEIQKMTISFQSKLINLVSQLEDKSLKGELNQLIEKRLKKLFISYENILKAIELQNLGVENEERKKIKDNMIYYDDRTKQYQGWYVDLYRNKKGKVVYSLNMYAHNFYMAKPISEVKFQGAIIYGSMNYPEFGLITIDDDLHKTKKLFLFSSYHGNEYPHGWKDEINFDGLKQLIFKRK